MESGSSSDIGSLATQNDSGVQENPVTPKRPRLERKSTKDGIVDNLFDEIARFSAVAAKLRIKDDKTEEDYRGLYRLYRTALKALNILESESKEIEEELLPFPSHAESVLQSTNDNVKLWSEYFYKKPTPTKIKRPNTIPSPPTASIGALIHAVASFFGITAEAICSNKRKPENHKHLEHLLQISKVAISLLKSNRDGIENVLEPYMKAIRDGHSSNSES